MSKCESKEIKCAHMSIKNWLNKQNVKLLAAKLSIAVPLMLMLNHEVICYIFVIKILINMVYREECIASV